MPTPTKVWGYWNFGSAGVTFIVINPVCVVIPDAVADLNVCVFVLLDGGDSKILAENLLTPGTDNTDNHLLLGRSPGCGKLTSPSSVLNVNDSYSTRTLSPVAIPWLAVVVIVAIPIVGSNTALLAVNVFPTPVTSIAVLKNLSLFLGYMCWYTPLSRAHVNANPVKITLLLLVPIVVRPWPTFVVTVITPTFSSYTIVDIPNGGA